jgi:RNA-binding proteins (RRM domain)
MKSIYVGNLPLQTTEDTIRALFAPYGMVDSVLLIFDHPDNTLRAHAFVEMADEDADEAIRALHGRQFGDQALEVSEVTEEPPASVRH